MLPVTSLSSPWVSCSTTMLSHSTGTHSGNPYGPSAFALRSYAEAASHSLQVALNSGGWRALSEASEACARGRSAPVPRPEPGTTVVGLTSVGFARTNIILAAAGLRLAFLVGRQEHRHSTAARPPTDPRPRNLEPRQRVDLQRRDVAHSRIPRATAKAIAEYVQPMWKCAIKPERHRVTTPPATSR